MTSVITELAKHGMRSWCAFYLHMHQVFTWAHMGFSELQLGCSEGLIRVFPPRSVCLQGIKTTHLLGKPHRIPARASQRSATACLAELWLAANSRTTLLSTLRLGIGTSYHCCGLLLPVLSINHKNDLMS